MSAGFPLYGNTLTRYASSLSGHSLFFVRSALSAAAFPPLAVPNQSELIITFFSPDASRKIHTVTSFCSKQLLQKCDMLRRKILLSAAFRQKKIERPLSEIRRKPQKL